MTSFLFSMIPAEVVYAIIAGAVLVAATVAYQLTRNIRVALVVLGVASVGIGGWLYRDALIAQGEALCVAKVEEAGRGLQSGVDQLKAERAAADQKRIAELETKLKAATDQAQSRVDVRASIPLDEHCEKCRVKRSWMRGEK